MLIFNVSGVVTNAVRIRETLVVGAEEMLILHDEIQLSFSMLGAQGKK
jgi:hypothetical protein